MVLNVFKTKHTLQTAEFMELQDFVDGALQW
jgi:hypothetical protein